MKVASTMKYTKHFNSSRRGTIEDYVFFEARKRKDAKINESLVFRIVTHADQRFACQKRECIIRVSEKPNRAFGSALATNEVGGIVNVAKRGGPSKNRRAHD